MTLRNRSWLENKKHAFRKNVRHRCEWILVINEWRGSHLWLAVCLDGEIVKLNFEIGIVS